MLGGKKLMMNIRIFSLLIKYLMCNTVVLKLYTLESTYNTTNTCRQTMYSYIVELLSYNYVKYIENCAFNERKLKI